MMCQKMAFNNMQYCFRVLHQLNICMITVGDFSTVGFTSALDNFNC